MLLRNESDPGLRFVPVEGAAKPLQPPTGGTDSTSITTAATSADDRTEPDYPAALLPATSVSSCLTSYPMTTLAGCATPAPPSALTSTTMVIATCCRLSVGHRHEPGSSLVNLASSEMDRVISTWIETSGTKTAAALAR